MAGPRRLWILQRWHIFSVNLFVLFIFLFSLNCILNDVTAQNAPPIPEQNVKNDLNVNQDGQRQVDKSNNVPGDEQGQQSKMNDVIPGDGQHDKKAASTLLNHQKQEKIQEKSGMQDSLSHVTNGGRLKKDLNVGNTNEQHTGDTNTVTLIDRSREHDPKNIHTHSSEETLKVDSRIEKELPLKFQENDIFLEESTVSNEESIPEENKLQDASSFNSKVHHLLMKNDDKREKSTAELTQQSSHREYDMQIKSSDKKQLPVEAEKVSEDSEGHIDEIPDESEDHSDHVSEETEDLIDEVAEESEEFLDGIPDSSNEPIDLMNLDDLYEPFDRADLDLKKIRGIYKYKQGNIKETLVAYKVDEFGYARMHKYVQTVNDDGTVDTEFDEYFEHFPERVTHKHLLPDEEGMFEML